MEVGSIPSTGIVGHSEMVGYISPHINLNDYDNWELMMGEDIKLVRLKEGTGPRAQLHSTVYCSVHVSCFLRSAR